MTRLISILLILLNINNMIIAQGSATKFSEPPSWSKNAIWYQIFVAVSYTHLTLPTNREV